MTIQLSDAAKYYRGLPHQKQAFDNLQNKLTSAIIEEFAEQYRNGPSLPDVNPVPPGRPMTSVSIATKKRPPAKTAQDYKDILKHRLNELGIKLYTGGRNGFGATIVAVEGVNLDLTPHADAPDKWNDIVMTVLAYPNGKWKIIGPFICTTEPGKYYTVNPLNPMGAAYVKLDVKHNAIWKPGQHKNQKNCFIQTGGPITVIRDSNRDGKRGSNEKEQTAYLGINLHHNNGNYNPHSIGKFSAGCLVLPNVQQHQVLINAAKTAQQNAYSYVPLNGHKL